MGGVGLGSAEVLEALSRKEDSLGLEFTKGKVRKEKESSVSGLGVRQTGMHKCLIHVLTGLKHEDG